MTGSPHKDRGVTTTARVWRALVAGAFVVGITALIATQQELRHGSGVPASAVDHAPVQTASHRSFARGGTDEPPPSLAERFAAP